MTDKERAALVNELLRWLETERAATVAAFEKDGIPLTKSAYRVFAERTHTHGDRTGNWSLVKTGGEKVELSSFGLCPKYVSLKWSFTTPPPTQDYDPNSKTSKLFFQWLVGDYLTGLKELSSPDQELAIRLINGYIDSVESPDAIQVEETVIGGIIPPVTPVDVTDSGINIRALTSEELGANLSQMVGIDFSSDDEPFMPDFRGVFEGFYRWPVEFTLSCVLTSREVIPRNKSLRGTPRLNRIVLALQLLGFGVTGRGMLTWWTEPGPRAGRSPEHILVPRTPEFEDRPVTAESLRHAAQLASLIPSTFVEPKRREEVALHQFSVGAAQESRADSVIAFTIALEALLVPGLLGENSYRFRLNGARYLGSTAEERRQIYDDLKEVYEMRSKLVHGQPPKEEALKDCRLKARRLAARGLQKALSEGWPTGAQFESAALA